MAGRVDRGAELQSNGPPSKMVLIVDSHGNGWNRVDQKFSIEPPIPSTTDPAALLRLRLASFSIELRKRFWRDAQLPTPYFPAVPSNRSSTSSSFIFFNTPGVHRDKRLATRTISLVDRKLVSVSLRLPRNRWKVSQSTDPKDSTG